MDTDGPFVDRADEERPPDAPDEPTQVWLVERTYSEDEQNMLILVYATTDGRFYNRKERALTSFSGSGPEVTAAIVADPVNLGRVADPDTVERYAREATRMAETHDSDDAI